MKYMLFVCWDAEGMNKLEEPEPGTRNEEDESFPWLDELQAAGKWLVGDQLAPVRRARSVQKRDGQVLVTDGPFAATKEAVGGFDLIEADSFDEAVRIAGEHPIAEFGTIEVRPCWGN